MSIKASTFPLLAAADATSADHRVVIHNGATKRLPFTSDIDLPAIAAEDLGANDTLHVNHSKAARGLKAADIRTWLIDKGFHFASQNQDIRYQNSVAAFMFDDGITADYINFPAFTSRNLPCGLAMDFHKMDSVGYVTTAQVKELQDKACEMLWHFHGEATGAYPVNPTDMADYYNRHVTIANIYRALGYNIQSFIQEGGPTGQWNLDTEAKIKSEQMKLLESEFALVQANIREGYLDFTAHPAPLPWRLGLARYNLQYYTAAVNITSIEDMIKHGGAQLFYWHSDSITLADIQTILDYVKAERDAGRLTVLTPTGLLFAHNGTDVNQLSDPSFESCTAPNTLSLFWAKGGTGTVPTITNTGGVDNAKYLTLHNNTYIAQRRLRPYARAFKLAFYAKSAAQPKNLTVEISGSMQNTNNVRDWTFSIDSATWKKFSLHFGQRYVVRAISGSIDPGPTIILQNTSDSDIDLDDVKLVEI
jgi:hypothetical protein